MIDNMYVYIAAPFFNEVQLRRVENIKEKGFLLYWIFKCEVVDKDLERALYQSLSD